MIRRRLIAVTALLLSASAPAVAATLGDRPPVSVANAAAIVSDTCTGADCVATCTCPAGTVIGGKAEQTGSTICTSSDLTTEDMGQTTTTTTENSLADEACCKILCVGN